MDMRKIGQFLAELRKEKELTQEQLGEKLGVTNKTVSRWENGNYLPPVEMLQALSEFYGLTINEILSAQRLNPDEYQQKAEENLKAVVSTSPFTLQDKIDFFKRKWKKEHFFTSLLIRLLIGCLLFQGIFTKNLLWTIGYAVASVAYYMIEQNQMMTYVESRAYDGTGMQ